MFMSVKNKYTPFFAPVEDVFCKFSPGDSLKFGIWRMLTSGVNGRLMMGWGQTGLRLWRPCILSLVLLAGCAVGPDFVRPKPPPVERYTHGATPTTTIEADGLTQRFDL